MHAIVRRRACWIILNTLHTTTITTLAIVWHVYAPTVTLRTPNINTVVVRFQNMDNSTDCILHESLLTVCVTGASLISLFFTRLVAQRPVHAIVLRLSTLTNYKMYKYHVRLAEAISQ